jgi:hypothetical protein
MIPAAEPSPSKDDKPVREMPEIGSAHKRDRLLQRVRAARSKLSPAPGPRPKLH